MQVSTKARRPPSPRRVSFDEHVEVKSSRPSSRGSRRSSEVLDFSLPISRQSTEVLDCPISSVPGDVGDLTDFVEVTDDCIMNFSGLAEERTCDSWIDASYGLDGAAIADEDLKVCRVRSVSGDVEKDEWEPVDAPTCRESESQCVHSEMSCLVAHPEVLEESHTSAEATEKLAESLQDSSYKELAVSFLSMASTEAISQACEGVSDSSHEISQCNSPSSEEARRESLSQEPIHWMMDTTKVEVDVEIEFALARCAGVIIEHSPHPAKSRSTSPGPAHEMVDASVHEAREEWDNTSHRSATPSLEQGSSSAAISLSVSSDPVCKVADVGSVRGYNSDEDEGEVADEWGDIPNVPTDELNVLAVLSGTANAISKRVVYRTNSAPPMAMQLLFEADGAGTPRQPAAALAWDFPTRPRSRRRTLSRQCKKSRAQSADANNHSTQASSSVRLHAPCPVHYATLEKPLCLASISQTQHVRGVKTEGAADSDPPSNMLTETIANAKCQASDDIDAEEPPCPPLDDKASLNNALRNGCRRMTPKSTLHYTFAAQLPERLGFSGIHLMKQEKVEAGDYGAHMMSQSVPHVERLQGRIRLAEHSMREHSVLDPEIDLGMPASAAPSWSWWQSPSAFLAQLTHCQCSSSAAVCQVPADADNSNSAELVWA